MALPPSRARPSNHRAASVLKLLPLSGHSGHGRTCCSLSPVANDPRSCHQDARWEGSVCSITSICLEREKGAESQEDDGSCHDRAGDLANSGGNRGESGWKKHSGKATQDEQPAKDGHKHRPSVRPAIVKTHNVKPSD